MITKIIAKDDNKIISVSFHSFEFGLKLYNSVRDFKSFEMFRNGFAYNNNEVIFIDDDLDLINDYHD